MPPPKRVQSLLRTQSERIDSALAEFTGKLAGLEKEIRGDLLRYFSQLDYRGGKIAATAANRAVLTGTGRQVQAGMEWRGYDEMVAGYLRQYGGQVELLREVFRELGVPLRFTAADDEFARRLVGRDRKKLLDVVSDIAAEAAARARLASGTGSLGERRAIGTPSIQSPFAIRKAAESLSKMAMAVLPV